MYYKTFLKEIIIIINNNKCKNAELLIEKEHSK